MKEYRDEPMLFLSKLCCWLCARTLARHAGGRGSKPGGGVEFHNSFCKRACAVWVVTISVWVLILARRLVRTGGHLHCYLFGDIKLVVLMHGPEAPSDERCKTRKDWKGSH